MSVSVEFLSNLTFVGTWMEATIEPASSCSIMLCIIFSICQPSIYRIIDIIQYFDMQAISSRTNNEAGCLQEGYNGDSAKGSRRLGNSRSSLLRVLDPKLEPINSI